MIQTGALGELATLAMCNKFSNNYPAHKLLCQYAKEAGYSVDVPDSSESFYSLVKMQKTMEYYFDNLLGDTGTNSLERAIIEESKEFEQLDSELKTFFDQYGGVE